MTDKQILARHIKLAEFISLCFSSDVEVVVHDASRLPDSAIAVFNGHISGRGAGSPMPDKVLGFLRNKDYSSRDHVLNYKGMTGKGTVVRSSAFFIRNEQNTVIGLLCVNVDISKHAHIIQIMESFIGPKEESPDKPPDEAASGSQHGMICDAITELCARSGRDLDTFTVQDRMDVIASLLRKGIFDRKGGVSDAANHLRVSEPTVYRYIKRARAALSPAIQDNRK